MGKQIHLSVPKPCHENWDSMNPVEKGRFCSSCNKEVMDFTGMTDSQLGAFFRKKPTGSVCGRFMNDQLNHDIPIPTKRIPWAKYFFQITLPLFIASFKSGAQQGKPVKPKQETTETSFVTVGMILPSKKAAPALSKEITGMITDKENNPVSFARLRIAGSSLGAEADRNGQFIIEVPARKKTVEIEISAPGYETSKVVWSKEDIQANEFRVIRLVEEDRDIENFKGRAIMGEIALAPLPEPDSVAVVDTAVMNDTIIVVDPILFEDTTALVDPAGSIDTAVAVDSFPEIQIRDMSVSVTYFQPEEEGIPLRPVINPVDAVIYPNPLVKGRTLTVELKSGAAITQVRVISQDGKIILTQVVSKNQRLFRLQTGSHWASGIYFIQLLNEKKEVVKTTKLIVQ